MLDQFSLFIFDMDGTLVDSGQLHEMAWCETLAHYGLPIDRQYMRSLAGVPTIATIEKIIERFECSIKFTLSDVAHYKSSIVQQNFRDFVRPTALFELVEEYSGKVLMSVGTGATTSEAREVLGVCGLLDFMGHVVGADQVSQAKPAPDTFLLCAKLMDVQPCDCLVFEDAKAGLEAAERAGMAAVDVLETFSIKNDYFL